MLETGAVASGDRDNDRAETSDELDLRNEIVAIARRHGDLDLGDGPRRYRRETNTMPNWAGSCWYYLRYLDPANDEALVDRGDVLSGLPPFVRRQQR